MSEKTIATYTAEKFRLQLLEITKENAAWDPVAGTCYHLYKYQVRLNRKIVKTSISEYQMRKLFAMYVKNQVLQLKIY